MQETELMLSREAVVKFVVEFCQKSPSPNVIPDNSQLILGKAGLSMFSGNQPGVAKVCFPFMPEHHKPCSSIFLSDPKVIEEFLSQKEKLFGSCDQVTNLYFVVCPEKGIGIRIPGSALIANEKLTAAIATVIEGTMAYYKDLFKVISDFIVRVNLGGKNG